LSGIRAGTIQSEPIPLHGQPPKPHLRYLKFRQQSRRG
jgi:hypothetical protein